MPTSQSILNLDRQLKLKPLYAQKTNNYNHHSGKRSLYHAKSMDDDFMPSTLEPPIVIETTKCKTSWDPSDFARSPPKQQRFNTIVPLSDEQEHQDRDRGGDRDRILFTRRKHDGIAADVLGEY